MLVMAVAFLFCVPIASSWAQEVGVTDSSIKIGMFAPLTGPVSHWGWPTVNGATTIYNEVNKAGGIHGRKIELSTMDDRCTPEGAKSAVKKLIYSDKVFLINGGVCSAAVFGTREEIINAKIPYMNMAATMDKIFEPVNRYLFSPTVPASMDGVTILEFLLSRPGTKRLALVAHPDEWARSKLEKGLLLLKEKYRLDLVANETMDRGAMDATPQILRIKEAKPDAVLTFIYPAEGAIFCRDANKYGLRVPFGGPNALMDLMDLRDRVGSWKPLENLYTATYLRASVTKFPELAKTHSSYFPKDKFTSLTITGMASAMVVIEGLKRAGRNLTRERLIDSWETLKDFDTKILSSRITFTEKDHLGAKESWIVTMVKDEEYYMQEGKWIEGLK